MDLNAIKSELEWYETAVKLGRPFSLAEVRQQVIQPLLDGYDRWQADLDRMHDEKTQAEQESCDLACENTKLRDRIAELRDRIAELEAKPVPVTYDDANPGIWPGGGLDPDSEMD